MFGSKSLIAVLYDSCKHSKEFNNYMQQVKTETSYIMDKQCSNGQLVIPPEFPALLVLNQASKQQRYNIQYSLKNKTMADGKIIKFLLIHDPLPNILKKHDF